MEAAGLLELPTLRRLLRRLLSSCQEAARPPGTQSAAHPAEQQRRSKRGVGSLDGVALLPLPPGTLYSVASPQEQQQHPQPPRQDPAPDQPPPPPHSPASTTPPHASPPAQLNTTATAEAAQARQAADAAVGEAPSPSLDASDATPEELELLCAGEVVSLAAALSAALPSAPPTSTSMASVPPPHQVEQQLPMRGQWLVDGGAKARLLLLLSVTHQILSLAPAPSASPAGATGSDATATAAAAALSGGPSPTVAAAVAAVLEALGLGEAPLGRSASKPGIDFDGEDEGLGMGEGLADGAGVAAGDGERAAAEGERKAAASSAFAAALRAAQLSSGSAAKGGGGSGGGSRRKGGAAPSEPFSAAKLRPTPRTTKEREAAGEEGGGEGRAVTLSPAAPGREEGKGRRGPARPELDPTEVVDVQEERLLRSFLNSLLADRGVRVTSLYSAAMRTVRGL